MRKLSSTTKYVLKALLPYSKQNLKLVFKPGEFFRELESVSKLNRNTVRSAYRRAISSGLIELDDQNIPRLTDKGRALTKPYKPSILGPNAKLLVMFDIPEDERAKRNHLRALLKELSFKKVQQSVWISNYDHRQYLLAELEEYKLSQYVVVYEAAQLNL